MTPPQIVYVAHGSPPVDGCAPAEGRCYVCCGEVVRGKSVRSWMGSGFSDHARVLCPSSPIVCEACCYVTSRITPVLGRPAGACSVCDGTLLVTKVPKAGKGSKSRKGDPCPKCDGTGQNPGGSNFRNVSHFYEAGWEGIQAPCYGNCSKGEKPAIRAFLEREHAGPWFAAIGDTGQLHVLPFAQMNGTGRRGVVLFERTLVSVGDVALIGAVADLLTAGATKEEIQSGDYGPNAWRLCEPQIREFEERYAKHRGGGWFSLSVWVAQRNEEEVQRRMAAEKEERDARKKKPARARKDRARGDGDGPAGPERSVHSDAGAQGAEALAAPTVSVRGESDGSGDDRAVAGVDKERAPNRDYEQVPLFGS